MTQGHHDLAPDAFLVCRSGALLCALRLDHVAETMRPLPVEPVPAMPSFLLGVAIIRGAVVPVVSVARLLGAPGESPVSRFVTVRLGARQVAFAVQSVLGVRSLNAESMARIPLLLNEVDSASVAAIGSLDAELLLVLQSARIIDESLWQAIDAQAAPS